MATRILITDAAGFPLAMLDGHHGAAHAAKWVDDMRGILRSNEGVAETMVFEITPAAGGDDFRQDVLQQLGRLRFETRRRPDGKREIIGAMLTPTNAAERSAAIPVPVGLHIRIVDAPDHLHGERQPIRIPRGRHAAVDRRTPAEKRQARRLAKAQGRA